MGPTNYVETTNLSLTNNIGRFIFTVLSQLVPLILLGARVRALSLLAMDPPFEPYLSTCHVRHGFQI